MCDLFSEHDRALVCNPSEKDYFEHIKYFHRLKKKELWWYLRRYEVNVNIHNISHKSVIIQSADTLGGIVRVIISWSTSLATVVTL